MPTLTERATTALKQMKTSPFDLAGTAAAAAGVATLGSVASGTAATGVVAGVAGFVGVSALTGGLAILAVGGLLLVPTLSRVLNPRRREDHLKNELRREDIQEYEYWNCRIHNVAVVGPRGTGKTTVKQLLRGLSPEGIASTTTTEYHLFRIQKDKDEFAALIDGVGAVETYGDQAKLARQAHVLIVVFDHYDTREQPETASAKRDENRLKSHERFVDQFFQNLAKTTPADLRGVILLMNKKDLWLEGADRPHIDKWMETLRADLLQKHASYLPEPTPFRPFGKNDKEDLTWLVGQIDSFVRKK